MAEIRVGRTDVRPESPSHVRGIVRGNNKRRQRGLHRDGTADARRSTGIRANVPNHVFPLLQIKSPAPLAGTRLAAPTRLAASISPQPFKPLSPETIKA